jgi:hypothetical protein
MTLEIVKAYPLCYVATPYSKFPGGVEVAYQAACELCARLLLAGVNVFSPIAHSHGIAVHGKLDPLDHKIWLPFDEAVMQASNALLVAKMKTWEVSYGIDKEIEWFTAKGKPVHYLDPVTFEVE